MEVSQSSHVVKPQRKNLKPALVTVGDELIFGERPNDNLLWLHQVFWEKGHPAEVSLTLPDVVATIAHWLRQLLLMKCFPIIVSGGIGGTHDDCTREGIARALDVPLVSHERCFKILAAKYGERFNAERQRMALLPQGCDLVANPFGAPGFSVGGIWAFPGFPSMLKPMMEEVLRHLLPETNTENWITREYSMPIHEGDIAFDIEAFARNHPTARVGIYPSAERTRTEVTVRLRCRAADQGTVEAFDVLVASLKKRLKLLS